MRRESGFTLLEVLVAFAIAAMSLTALFQASRAGLDNTAVAARMLEATGVAQSTLATALRAEPLTVGTQSGTGPAEFAWRIVVAPAGAKPPGSGTQFGPAIYRVDVSVGWSAGTRYRSVNLTGYRLALQRQAAND